MKIGYALYSAREECRDPESLFRTLQALAQMGYDGVEFYGYAGTPAAMLKKELEHCGIQGISTHIPAERWHFAPEEFDYAAEAGIPFVTFPWLAPDARTRTVYDRLEEAFPRLIRLCAERGLRMQYHNHDWEFAKGGRLMDSLLMCSPELMHEPDTFWMHYAGTEPCAYLRRRRDRIAMIHIKDYTSLREPRFCAIGEGLMDNAAIVKTAAELRIPWVIVELDDSPLPPLESAASSLRYVRSAVSSLSLCLEAVQT